MRESAEVGKDEARSRARVDERDMKNGIIVLNTKRGAKIVGTDWKTVWHEYGTGIYAGAADMRYPNQRGSTGSEADEIPWVYLDENGNFWTTYGVMPQPMIRPGFEAGVEEFKKQKRQRGL